MGELEQPVEMIMVGSVGRKMVDPLPRQPGCSGYQHCVQRMCTWCWVFPAGHKSVGYIKYWNWSRFLHHAGDWLTRGDLGLRRSCKTSSVSRAFSLAWWSAWRFFLPRPPRGGSGSCMKGVYLLKAQTSYCLRGWDLAENSVCPVVSKLALRRLWIPFWASRGALLSDCAGTISSVRQETRYPPRRPGKI